MTTVASPTAPPARTPDAKRRRKIAKFALAGVAVLGVGAALTSAAWTDDVFFAADATSGTFDLQGSLDGTNWFDVANIDDTSVTPIQIPATAFENLAPGDVRVVTLNLRNAGSVDLTLGAPVVTENGALFANAGANVGVTVGAYGASTLAAGAATTFTVTLTVPDWTNTDYTNLTGDILVAVTGTSA
jgi:anti-sigma factor RsiW